MSHFNKESLDKQAQNIVISSEALLLVKPAIKIATTKPISENVKALPGEIIQLCSPLGTTKESAIVIDNIQKPLGSISISRLSLGGFFSIEQAITGLSTFFGKTVDRETIVKHVTFLAIPIFNSLNLEQKMVFLSEPIEQLIKLPPYGNILLRSNLYWFLNRKNGSVKEWVNFLIKKSIIGIEDPIYGTFIKVLENRYRSKNITEILNDLLSITTSTDIKQLK